MSFKRGRPRVLVTGANGFIGRRVVESLRRTDHDVVCCSRHRQHDLGRQDLEWLSADLLNPVERHQLVTAAESDVLVHLAWYTEHGQFWKARENFEWSAATISLVDDFLRRGGGRVVLAGTCAEYDWTHGYCTEYVTPERPATAYGITKDATRRLTQALCNDAGVEFAWARVFLPFGSGEPNARLSSAVIRALLRDEPIRCSHGQQIRDFIHVDDVASAFVHLSTPGGPQGIFNVCTSEPVRIRDFVELCVQKIKPNRVPDFGALTVQGDDPPFLVGNSKRIRESGWAPAVSLSQGIDQTIDSLRAAPSH